MIQHGNGSVYRGGYKGFKYEGKGKLTHKFDSKIHQDHKEKFAAGQGVSIQEDSYEYEGYFS